MLDDLKKRDCNIKIKLTPSGAQFLHVEIDIQGDHLEFLPASSMGGQFGEAVGALYALFHENDDSHRESKNREYRSDEEHSIDTVVTRFEWDNEGTLIEVVLSRKLEFDIDFENDATNIEIMKYGRVLKSYTVKSKDLCYAVAKACTEALKEYGFYGYRCSTEYDYFKVHQLLYIKSFALLNFEARELTVRNENEWAKRTSFEKEIALLLFDM